MGTVSTIRPEPDAEERALDGLRALIEQEVARQIASLEELLRARRQSSEVEEYIDKAELARRIHTNPKTIDDWIYKKKIPFIKLPTGTVRFRWSAVLAWMGQQ